MNLLAFRSRYRRFHFTWLVHMSGIVLCLCSSGCLADGQFQEALERASQEARMASKVSTEGSGSPEAESNRNAVDTEAASSSEEAVVASEPAFVDASFVVDGQVNLQRSIQFGLQQNLNIRISQSQVSSAAEDLTIANAEFDPRLDVDASIEGPNEDTTVVSSQAAVSAKIPTGGILAVGGRIFTSRVRQGSEPSFTSSSRLTPPNYSMPSCPRTKRKTVDQDPALNKMPPRRCLRVSSSLYSKGVDTARIGPTSHLPNCPSNRLT